ncbi:MAG: phage holin family protein [Candidatus Latescibacterota bacterium]
MKGFLTRWGITALALLIVTHLFKRIHADSTQAVVVAALLLGIVNAFIRPVILIITLPLNLLTLGLFTFLINGVLLLIVAKLVAGFTIAGFWTGVFGALMISLISIALSALIGKGKD